MFNFKRISMVASLVAVLVLPLAGAVAAATPQREVFHDQWSEVISGFCVDLEIRVDGDIRGAVTFRQRGADQLGYYQMNVHGSFSWTNLATGKTMTDYVNYIDKDLKVTDNGDGTLSIIGLATGGDRLVGPDGKLLLRDPGQIRYELLIDHMGTPGDPSDDELIEDYGVFFGSTGRNDWDGVDICALVHETLG